MFWKFLVAYMRTHIYLHNIFLNNVTHGTQHPSNYKILGRQCSNACNCTYS